MRFLFVVLLVLGGAGAGSAGPEDVIGDPGRPAGLASGLGYVELGKAPVVAVHGPRSRRDATRVALDAPWHVGSITKSFTASLIARMAARGDLSLDASLGDLVPDLAEGMHPDWRGLTLAALLSHTGGLQRNFSRLEMVRPAQGTPMEERRARLATHWQRALPGAPGQPVYSNMGYVLAGHVAESVAGRPWQDLIREEIAAPLGLDSLGFGAPDGPGVAYGHGRGLMGPRPVPPEARWADNPAWLGPAGTLHLSMADLLRWGAAHLEACQGARPDFLSQEMCQRLRTPVAEGFALGWVVGEDAQVGHVVQWHNGSNTRWFAVLSLVPERGLVVAYAINGAKGQHAHETVRALTAALLFQAE